MKNAQSKEYKWNLEAFERRGNLWLKWSTNDAIRAQQGQVRVYSGNKFPEHPHENINRWVWTDNHDLKGEWDTGLRWGDDWPCAIVSDVNSAFSTHGQMYVVKLITQTD